MPQHEHIERHVKLHGKRFDSEERERKKEARLVHKRSEFTKHVHGIRAKIFQKKRATEKATMRKTIAQHNERNNKHADSNDDNAVASGAVPAYLLDRQGVSRAKVLSNSIKQKRKEKAGKWETQGETRFRRRTFRCGEIRKTTAQGLEAHGNKMHLCGR
jgi:ribosome biogenesis protein NSA2